MALAVNLNEVEKFVDNFPYLLQSTRLKKGLSCTQAARQIGVSITIVTGIEQEKRVGNITTLRKVVKWMNSLDD